MAPGRLMRPAAMSMPGMILSQLAMYTTPSKQLVPLTMASTESAMTSREGRL